MFLLSAAIGLGVGSLLNWASDYLPRFASDRRIRVQSKTQPRWSFALGEYLASALSRKKSSGRLPARLNAAVELFTAVLFVGLSVLRNGTADLFYAAAVGIFFILIAIIDLKYRLILNVLIFPAMLLVVLVRFTSPGTNLLAVLLGGAFGFSIFWLAALVRPGELGAGDIKLATLIGLLFGFPNAIWALLIAVLAGGVAVIFLLWVRHSPLSTRIPYAPFLCLGAVSMLLASPFLTFQ